MKPVIKIITLVVLLLLCTPTAWLAKKLRKPEWTDVIMRRCSQLMLRVIGVRLSVEGSLEKARPLLLVSNHLTYLDVPILASQNAVRFTPKSEIADWPLFGWMCRVTGCIFVTRKAEKLKQASNAIADALAKGEAVSLFPEGSTGDGRHLLPFKSGFFSLAEAPLGGQELLIQPASIAYTHVRGLPIDITLWPDVAWYGDMELVPHLWNLLKITPLRAKLTYLPPVTLSQFADRKELSKHCQQVISDSLDASKN